MSDTDAAARPRQLTMAACFVTGGSVLLVLSVFDGLANLHSVETRTAVAGGLAASTRLGASIGVDGVLALMRVGLNLAAVCAAIAAVLGVFVLQRHRGARIVLSVLAVPILLTAPLTGGFVGAMVAAAIAMLWTGPARDWFAGRPVRESTGLFDRSSRPTDGQQPDAAPPAPLAPPDSGSDGRDAAPPTPPSVSADSTSAAPRPSHGYGEAPVRVDQPSSPTGQPGQPVAGPQDRGNWQAPPQAQWHGPGQGPAQGPWQGAPPQPGWSATPTRSVPVRRVPVAVKIACTLTWVFSVAFLVVLVTSLIQVASDSSALLRDAERTQAVERAGLSPDALVPMLWVGGAMLVGWALVAMLLAWFVWRRHDWARWLLVVSAAAVFVAGMVAFPVGLPLQGACVVTIGLLFRSDVREWFSPRAHHPQSGGPGDPGGRSVW